MSAKSIERGKLLWIEDVPKSIRANVEYLEQHDVLVSIAISFEEAVEFVRGNVYDVIIVDYSIPYRSRDVAETNCGLGVRFIRMLKAGEFGAANQQARVVLCTVQRESIGSGRSVLESLGVAIMPKANSYFAIVDLASEMFEVPR
jgi:CheY-like chemotaxis protein